jgi:hypothetical protein
MLVANTIHAYPSEIVVRMVEVAHMKENHLCACDVKDRENTVD